MLSGCGNVQLVAAARLCQPARLPRLGVESVMRPFAAALLGALLFLGVCCNKPVTNNIATPAADGADVVPLAGEATPTGASADATPTGG